jgi:hypothetical protein
MSPSVLTSADMFDGRKTVLHGGDGDQEIVAALIQHEHQLLRARKLLSRNFGDKHLKRTIKVGEQ